VWLNVKGFVRAVAEHITIEDRDVFPAAARLLSATQIHEVGREMAKRRMLRVQKD